MLPQYILNQILGLDLAIETLPGPLYIFSTLKAAKNAKDLATFFQKLEVAYGCFGATTCKAGSTNQKAQKQSSMWRQTDRRKQEEENVKTSHKLCLLSISTVRDFFLLITSVDIVKE